MPQVESKVELANTFGEMGDDLGRRRRECDVLKAKVGEFRKRYATLHGAHKANEMKIEELESKVALDAKAIAYLATLM